MATIDTAPKHRTITLTDRPPVKIIDDEWPLIASANWYEGEHASQANRSGWLKVRQHEDGRTIVYGAYDSLFPTEDDLRGGEMLTAGSDIAAAINRVAQSVRSERECAARCIADLPAEEI